MAREASVLVPVFRSGGEIRVVLVVRGARGLHGGQIGLPGGNREPSDESPLRTALREAREEIGWAENEIRVLGALEPIRTRTTHYDVHPFLAAVPPPPPRPVGEEVVDVVTPAIAIFADDARRSERLCEFPTWSEPRRVPAVELDDGRLVWGFTLRLLDRVLPRVAASEWSL